MKVAAAQCASIPGDIVANVRRHVPLATPGLPHLAMLIFRPFAAVVAHAKRWLHGDEVPWFSAGDAPTVFDVDGERLAPAICFEALQREHRRTVVLANAVGPFADGVAGGRSAAWRPDGTLAASLEATGDGLVCVDTEGLGYVPGSRP